MKIREIIIHFLGALLVLSTVYHSGHNFLSLVLIAPVLITSIGIRLDEQRLYVGGLLGVSLIGSFFIASRSMADITVLTIFLSTFALPLLIYWGTILSEKISFDPTSALVSASYVIGVILFFYALIFTTNINEYLLSIGNKAPQTLVLIASAITIYMPIHAITGFKRA